MILASIEQPSLSVCQSVCPSVCLSVCLSGKEVLTHPTSIIIISEISAMSYIANNNKRRQANNDRLTKQIMILASIEQQSLSVCLSVCLTVCLSGCLSV